MGCFGSRMTYAWSTTKTCLDNVDDDKRWGTTKRQEWQQGMTKW